MFVENANTHLRRSIMRLLKNETNFCFSLIVLVYHQIEVTLERVNGMLHGNQEVWGETDCYIQYYFPEQKRGSSYFFMTYSTFFCFKVMFWKLCFFNLDCFFVYR